MSSCDRTLGLEDMPSRYLHLGVMFFLIPHIVSVEFFDVKYPFPRVLLIMLVSCSEERSAISSSGVLICLGTSNWRLTNIQYTVTNGETPGLIFSPETSTFAL